MCEVMGMITDVVGKVRGLPEQRFESDPISGFMVGVMSEDDDGKDVKRLVMQ